MDNPIIVILGPTASGKTKLAAQLAYTLGTEIISGDSRQVYRGMTIGSGKDYAEYEINNHQIPYHLIDMVDAGEEYHLTAFITAFYKAYQQIQERNKIPIFCGGSGLYMEAALKGFPFAFVPIDAQLRKELLVKDKLTLEQTFNDLTPNSYTSLADTSTSKRLIRAIEISNYLNNNEFIPPQFPKLNPIVFGLDPPVSLRRKNIELRLRSRLSEGLIEEVEVLLKKVPQEKLIRYGMEYKYVTQYLSGEITKETMINQLTIAIQQFAKRQMTFFRKMEKDGLKVEWLNTKMTTVEQVQIMIDRIALIKTL